MRSFILSLSLVGVLFFGGAFVVSFVDPLLIERAAREVVRIEIERRVGQKIDALSNTRLAGLAQKLLSKTDEDMRESARALRDEVPQRVANVVADMLKADCECRKRLVRSAVAGAQEHISSLSLVRGQLLGFIEASYPDVAKNLMRELRIFTGSNAVVFVLLGVAALMRRKATVQLLVPATILVFAVLISAYLYLFNQNWLHTILFSSYVGFGYSALLLTVALLLGDVLLNRARVITRVLNAVLDIAGSAVTVSPC